MKIKKVETIYVDEFWQMCCSGKYHKELFATALSRSTKMKAAYEARLKKRKAARAAV